MRIKSFCLKKCSAALFLIGKLTIAEALTLGALQGGAVLGRPLDVTATVQLGAGESATELCLDASITQGDSKDTGTRVRLIGESTQTPGQFRVRISSSTALIEPVVNVELRAGCKQTLTRQYVLLTDLEAEQNATPLVSFETDRGKVAAPDAVPAAVAFAKAPVSAELAAMPVPGTNKPTDSRKAPSAPTAPVVTKPQPANAVNTKVPAKTAVVKSVAKPEDNKSEASAGSKLKLSASQVVLAEKSPELKSSRQLQQTPTDNAELSAQAKAIWAASNKSAEDVAAEAKRVAEFQSDIKTLRSQVQNNEKLLLEMRTALQNAENGRVDVTWLYLLGIGFAASSAAGVLLWRRQQVAQKQVLWSTDAKNEARADTSRAPEVQVQPIESKFSADLDVEPLGQIEVPEMSAPVDIDLDVYESITNPPSLGAVDLPLPPLEAPAPPAPAVPRSEAKPVIASAPKPVLAPAPARPQFVPSVQGNLRVATVEELFDIRQQAEFFVSLGQYDQAVQILQDCIGETEEARPIAYLDLLEIYHTLGRKRDFDACVNDFNQIFSGRIPSFENFKNAGHGIDEYPEYFLKIESGWASAATLEVIESLIFVNPQNSNQTYFDLAAFNDLLLLHSIAKRVLGAEAGFVDTNRAALIKNPFVTPNAPVVTAVSPEFDTMPSLLTAAVAEPTSAAASSANAQPVVEPKAPSKDNNLIDFDFVLPDDK
ncbi:MAG: hypothetical protein RL459_1588 [Pseudomonadota bacterium]